MAIIFDGSAWQSDFINFTSKAVPGGQHTFDSETVFSPGFFNYSLNDVSGSLHLRGFPVTQGWSTSGDGTTHAVIGNDLTENANGDLTGGTTRVLISTPTDNLDAGLAIIGVTISRPVCRLNALLNPSSFPFWVILPSALRHL